MISVPRDDIQFTDCLVVQLIKLVDDADVADLINRMHLRRRGAGGRTAAGIRYTIQGVLVAAACLLSIGSPPSLAAIHRTLTATFTDKQRALVGVHVPAGALLDDSRRAHWASYKQFHEWLTSRLRHLDPDADIPARKLTNRDARARLSAREARDRARSRFASHVLHTVANRIVAASVYDKAPEGYEGDIVVDETTYDVGKVTRGDGGKPDARGSAVPLAALYSRRQGRVEDPTGDGFTRGVDFSKPPAFGIGVTAITRVGSPGNIRKVIPVITAIAFGPTTSASVTATAEALKHHRANGFDPRDNTTAGRNKRWPTFTTDMGYNVKNGWAELLHAHQYEILGRLPSTWHTVTEILPATNKPNQDPTPPGPIQAFGALYCPFAAELVNEPLVKPAKDLERDGGEAHDQRLAALLPLLMGVNSRVRMAAPTAGRPSRATKTQRVPKVELVCPAVQLRVRCQLKPASMEISATQARTINPSWTADSKQCCAQSHITATLTPQQFKQHQAGPPPGSWEHTYLYEAYRALTERVFSVLKSPHVTNIQALNWGPRREPMIVLTIALAVAISNERTQFATTPKEIDSYLDKLRKLEVKLGRRPTKTPPRT